MCGGVAEDDPARADLEEDEYVQDTQADAVDGKEVAGQNRAGVSAEKLRPSRTRAPWRRAESVKAKDLADRRVRDPVAELEEFTLNPALAPTRVFSGHADEQAAYLLWDRRATTTGSASESRPAPADQFRVPAQDGGRCEQQAPDGQSAAESCQNQAVGREQVWSLHMAAEDGSSSAGSCSSSDAALAGPTGGLPIA